MSLTSDRQRSWSAAGKNTIIAPADVSPDLFTARSSTDYLPGLMM